MLNAELQKFLLKKNEYVNTAFTLLRDKKCGYQRARYQNSHPEAEITGLSLLLLDNRFEQELSIFLDFKDKKSAQTFFTKYAAVGANNFIPASFGALEENAYQAYAIRPLSFMLTFSFDQYGYDINNCTEVKQKLQDIIAAVQEFDPLDKKNFQHLTENFFLNMQDTHSQKFIPAKKFYFEGAATQFFSRFKLPADVVHELVAHMDDKTNRSIATVAQATHDAGCDNLTKHFKLG